MNDYKDFPYLLELGGEIVAGFMTAMGLGLPIGEPLTSFPNIVLLNGRDDSNVVRDWQRRVTDGAAQYREDGAVIKTDSKGNEIERWEFSEGWPCSYEFGAGSYDINKVEIAIEHLTRVES